ncbi:Iws1-like protein [Thalictrum thalictroides]|uniref:Iws1-like protein n=1 Tax=Thalictrum thalictroides TaxID=46969 RepID=A0A7J6X010_THATH|nr:Iws1-like protein [Thalictrum thalictroides]
MVDDSEVESCKTKQRCSKIRKEIIDDEIEALFNKKRRTSNNSDVDDQKTTKLANISFLVEEVMATLEVAAEEDADLNRNSQPAVNKLKKVPLLTQFLSKKHLQLEFLDHGVLCLLKKWLEPLPDGSLPNTKPASNKPCGVMTLYTDVDLDLSERQKSPQRSTQHVSRPEPLPMDFVVSPLSKINPDMVRERAKQREQAKVQQRIHKKLQQLKSRRRHAAPSVKAFPICV